MSLETISALTSSVHRQFKEDRTLCPVRALYLVQVKAHDIRAFVASSAFYGGITVDQIMQICHWTACNIFYVKDLTWSDNDSNMSGSSSTGTTSPRPFPSDQSSSVTK